MANHIYLEALHKCFVVVIIDKTANNLFCFYFQKKYYIPKLLAELVLSNSKSEICLKATHSIKKVIQVNKSYCTEFDLNITELNETRPFMYWMPKKHETPIGAGCIVAIKNAAQSHFLMQYSKFPKSFLMLSKVFMIKSFFIQAIRNSVLSKIIFPIVTKLSKININKKTKSISTFDFSALYTTIPHKPLIKAVSEVINCFFKSRVKKRIDFSKTSIY